MTNKTFPLRVTESFLDKIGKAAHRADLSKHEFVMQAIEAKLKEEELNGKTV